MKLKSLIPHIGLLFLSALLIGRAYLEAKWGVFLFIALLPAYLSLSRLYEQYLFDRIAVTTLLKDGFFLGWLFGALMFVQGLWWLKTLSVPFMVFTVLYCALFIAMTFVLVLYAKVRCPAWPWFMLLSIVWVFIEYVRGNTLLAFSAGSLGYGLIDYRSLIQIARVVGVYGVSFFIVFVNGLCFEFVINKAERRLVILNIVALFVLVLSYSIFTMKLPLSATGMVRTALVQGHLSRRDHALTVRRKVVLDTYAALALKAAEERPALIVLPEATIQGDLLSEQGGRTYHFFSGLAHYVNTYLLVGARQKTNKGARQLLFNAAYLLSPQGNVVDVYDKVNLVPFFERVVLSERFAPLKKLRLRGIQFDVGREYTVFDAVPGRFSVLICFESQFGELARQFVNRGAEFLVNISNDDDLGGNRQVHRLNRSMCIFRAIENYRYLVRCTRWGEGFIVDPYGKIIKRIPFGKRGWLIASIMCYQNKTIYSRYGDISIIILFILLSLCVVFSHTKSRL